MSNVKYILLFFLKSINGSIEHKYNKFEENQEQAEEFQSEFKNVNSLFFKTNIKTNIILQQNKTEKENINEEINKQEENINEEINEQEEKIKVIAPKNKEKKIRKEKKRKKKKYLIILEKILFFNTITLKKKLISKK